MPLLLRGNLTLLTPDTKFVLLDSLVDPVLDRFLGNLDPAPDEAFK